MADLKAQLKALIAEGLTFAAAMDVFASERSARELAYAAAAGAVWGRDGDIEVDGNAMVSEGDDPGAYVQAWVWVPASAAGLTPVSEDDV